MSLTMHTADLKHPFGFPEQEERSKNRMRKPRRRAYSPRRISGVVREDNEIGETPLRCSWGALWRPDQKPKGTFPLSGLGTLTKPVSQERICHFCEPGATAPSLCSMGICHFYFSSVRWVSGGQADSSPPLSSLVTRTQDRNLALLEKNA